MQIYKNVRNFVQKYIMTKVLSITEFRSNLASELELIGNNSRNQLIIKRPKSKGNIVVYPRKPIIQWRKLYTYYQVRKIENIF